MNISTYRTETIVVNNPSDKIISVVNKMREHKLERRRQMRDIPPMFTLTV